MPKVKPKATVVIQYFDDKTEVRINGFDKLTPGKIQRSLDFVIREWQRQQQAEINAKRKEIRDAA